MTVVAWIRIWLVLADFLSPLAALAGEYDAPKRLAYDAYKRMNPLLVALMFGSVLQSGLDDWRSIPTPTKLAELVFPIARASSSGDFGEGSEVIPRQRSLQDNTSPPPSRRLGPSTLPVQAGLPKADLSDPDSRLRLLCKVSQTEAVIELSGIVSERRYDEKDLVIEVNKDAATISIHGISADGRSQHYGEARISEYQIDAAKVASKRGLTVLHGIVLNRLTGVVKITSERWRDAGEHLSFVHEYAGPCKAAANGRSNSVVDEVFGSSPDFIMTAIATTFEGSRIAGAASEFSSNSRIISLPKSSRISHPINSVLKRSQRRNGWRHTPVALRRVCAELLIGICSDRGTFVRGT